MEVDGMKLGTVVTTKEYGLGMCLYPHRRPVDDDTEEDHEDPYNYGTSSCMFCGEPTAYGDTLCPTCAGSID